jgi:hypothetical protein
MTELSLTDAEAARLKQILNPGPLANLPQPSGPKPGTWAHAQAVEQERRRQERMAAARVRAEAEAKQAAHDEAEHQKRLQKNAKRIAELEAQIAESERAIFSAPSIDAGRVAKYRTAALKAELAELTR